MADGLVISPLGPGPLSGQAFAQGMTSDVQGSRTLTTTKPKERIIEKYKNEIGWINVTSNGIGIATHLATFLLGNFSPQSGLIEPLEKACNFLYRTAKGIQGLICGVDAAEKRNSYPLFGNAMEVLISLLVKDDYNRWRYRGIAQGTTQFMKIFEQKSKYEDENGKPIPGPNGKIEFVGADFSDAGFVKGFEAVTKEIPKITKELINEPVKRMKQFSHSTFLFSLFMIAGSALTFLGLPRLGAAFRDTGGAAVDITFMLEKDIKDNPNVQKSQAGSNFFLGKSSLFWAGVAWIWASVFDFLKIFPYFSEKVSHITQLSLASDLGASILYNISNINATNKGS